MSLLSRIRRSLRLGREGGQSLVEFAIAIPFLLLIVLALFDFGRGIFFWLDATHVANEGARLAAVNGSQMDCPTLAKYIQQQTVGELQSGASAPTSGIQAPSTVTISFPSGGTPQIGDPVTVTVAATFKYVPAGYIPGTLPITTSATMRLEQAPIFTTGCSA